MKKILLVDDEVDIAMSVKNGLERKGFTVDMYTDPKKSLDEFKAGVYDLLLLDIRMPKINGFKLYREMSRIDNEVKVCFITAFDEYHEEFKQAFPELDETRFIRKPTNLSDLVERLFKELKIVS